MDEEEKTSFSSFQLDGRLLRALEKHEFYFTTPIQKEAIPLGLKGKDLLVRARTGSGKTLVYLIPLLDLLLRDETKLMSDERSGPRAVILVPTRDLCVQVHEVIGKLTHYCSRSIRCALLNGDTKPKDQRLERAMLLERPDIIISTPSRLLFHLDEGGSMDLKESLRFLAMDEADLMISFGYSEDVRRIVETYLPAIYQSCLVSATLTSEVDQLKRWILRTPAILKLEETDLVQEDGDDEDSRKPNGGDRGKLEHYSILCDREQDRYLMIYAIIKLGLVQGKSLFFVNNVEQAYKLKLFFEQFSIKSCVLNADLPHISRYHTVQEFNRNIYEYLIATDVAITLPLIDQNEKKTDENLKTLETNSTNDHDEPTTSISQLKDSIKTKKQRKQHQQQIDYGVARGIDFQNVANVINFDLPLSPNTYIHRVGRTARGHASGRAITFVLTKDQEIFDGIKEAIPGSHIQPFAFKMNEIEGFRYRIEDGLRAVTRIAIKEARWNDYKKELLNSERLKAHFKQHPDDLHVLRHDKTLQHPARIQSHLKHIPDYLVPTGLSPPAHTGSSTGELKKRKPEGRTYSKASGDSTEESPSKRRNFRKFRDDPLKSFRFSRPSTEEIS